jgi:hypothetical protein
MKKPRVRIVQGINLTLLDQLLKTVEYKEGWSFEIKEGWAIGPFLHIGCPVVDSYTHQQSHLFHLVPIPAYPAQYGPIPGQAWARWIFQCIADVEVHEAMEHLEIGGEKIFNPNHDDPYAIFYKGQRIS